MESLSCLVTCCNQWLLMLPLNVLLVSRTGFPLPVTHNRSCVLSLRPSAPSSLAARVVLFVLELTSFLSAAHPSTPSLAALLPPFRSSSELEARYIPDTAVPPFAHGHQFVFAVHLGTIFVHSMWYSNGRTPLILFPSLILVLALLLFRIAFLDRTLCLRVPSARSFLLSPRYFFVPAFFLTVDFRSPQG